MKVNVLGCYGRYAPYNGATSGYLLNSDNGKNIIIDFGAGVLANLQKYISIDNIDIIILTHLHFDHVSDIGTLKYALGYLGVKGIKLYLPKTPSIMSDLLISNDFEVHYLDDQTHFEIDDIKFSFVKTNHPIETYAVRVAYKDKILAYTSDCKVQDMAKITENANVVIGDACILDSVWSENSPHLSVRQLATNIPKNCKLYLAHLTSGDEEKILKEAITYHSESSLVKDFYL